MCRLVLIVPCCARPNAQEATNKHLRPGADCVGEEKPNVLHCPPVSKRIHLDRVLASQKTACPKCGRAIEPAEIRRVNFEEMVCPSCGSQFRAGSNQK